MKASIRSSTCGSKQPSQRATVQACVVSLEQVQPSSFTTPFTVSQVVQQEHPRFTGCIESEAYASPSVAVEGMRGVLESCWDLKPTTPLQAQPVYKAARHAQLQRLRRSRRNFFMPTPSILEPRSSLKLQGQSRSSATSAAAAAATKEVGRAVRALAPRSATDQQTHYLQVLLNLLHLYTTHAGDDNSAKDFTRPSAFLPRTPRLMTAEEERVLGSIVQQHRKLQQLKEEFPDIAAAAFSSSHADSSSASVSHDAQATDAAVAASNSAASSLGTVATTMTSSGSSGGGGGGGSSSSSSSSRRAKRGVDRRVKWPPALTAEDIAEVTSLSPAWRTMLPLLASQAEQLLVVYNSGLLVYMIRRSQHLQGMPEEDLLSAGMAGLRLAAARYDPRMGTRFSTFATAWMGQHISRSSTAESGKVMRRPTHHIQMVAYVSARHGVDALMDIEHRPAIIAEVASHFGLSPQLVLSAIKDTFAMSHPTSLEASILKDQSSKGENSSTVLGAMLTTTDLDEAEDLLGGPGQDTSTIGGAGSLMAAAGQVPFWAQAGLPGVQQLSPPAMATGPQQQQQQRSQQASSRRRNARPSSSSSSDGSSTAVSEAQIQDAAVRLVQLAASPTPSAAAVGMDGVTSLMSSFGSDTEATLQSSMQELLHMLSPLERRVISLLYDLEENPQPAGLGREIAAVDFGTIRSFTGGSSKATGFNLADTQGHNPKVLPSARSHRGTMTLKQVARKLQLPSHQLVANIRNMALGKLAAAARQATADSRSSTSSRSSTGSSPAAADTAGQAGASKCSFSQGYACGSTAQLIALTKQYVEERGCLPAAWCERYQGKLLARWVKRIRTRYWQGLVSEAVVAAVEAAVPLWDWGQPPQLIQQRQAPDSGKQQRQAPDSSTQQREAHDSSTQQRQAPDGGAQQRQAPDSGTQQRQASGSGAQQRQTSGSSTQQQVVQPSQGQLLAAQQVPAVQEGGAAGCAVPGADSPPPSSAPPGNTAALQAAAAAAAAASSSSSSSSSQQPAVRVRSRRRTLSMRQQ